MSRKLLQFCCAILVLLLPAAVLAEPAKAGSGRLTDGRAYRIDANGYRIIDELAELEVTVAELERQNGALEDESKDKQKIIEQLRQGKCAAASVTETDLSAKKIASNLPPPASVSCAASTEPLKQRISELETRLASQNESIKAKDSSVRYGEQQSALLKTELDSARQQLAQAPTASQLDDLREKNKALESSLAELEQRLSASESKNMELASNLEEARSTAAARAALTNQPVNAALQRGSAPASRSASTDRGPTIADRVETTEARREFKSQLAKIDSKISERKRLLDSVQSRKLGVTMSVQPLKTSDGRSLDSLRMVVSSNFPESEIDSIRSGLGQIEKILDEDLSVFHRLGRI